jgi:hypothetical protein
MNRLVMVGALAFGTGVAGGTWMSPARTAVHDVAADSTASSHDEEPLPTDAAGGVESHAAPVAETPAPPMAADSVEALAAAIKQLPATTAVAMLNRSTESEVMAVLRQLELPAAVELIEQMPAERAARFTRQLLLGAP